MNLRHWPMALTIALIAAAPALGGVASPSSKPASGLVEPAQQQTSPPGLSDRNLSRNPQDSSPTEPGVPLRFADFGELEALQLGALAPATPIAGQPAQLAFQVDLRALRDSDLQQLLSRRLRLRIAGRPVPIGSNLSVAGVTQRPLPSAKSVGEIVSVTANGNLTFTWPAYRDGALTIGGPRSEIVELSDAGNEADPRRQVVLVTVPTSPFVYMAVAEGVGLILATGFWLYWRQRKRTSPGARPDQVKPSAESAAPPDDEVAETSSSPAAFVDGSSSESPLLDASLLHPPDALAAAAGSGQTVLVLGAGASAAAGAPTPLAAALDLLSRLGPDAPPSFASVLESDNPAETLRRMADRLGDGQRLLDALVSATPRDLAISTMRASRPTQPSPLHGLLGEFPWRAVIDLNLDDLMLDALRQGEWASEPSVQVLTVNEAIQPQAARTAERLFLRPYGTYEQPAAIALTYEEMRRGLSRAPDFQRLVAGLLQSQTFLFVGVSPDAIEQFLYAVAPDFQDSHGRHYVVRHYALLADDAANSIWSTTLAPFGVQLLPYDPRPGGYGPRQFLRDLLSASRRLAAKAPSGPSYKLSADRVRRIRLENIGPFAQLDLAVGEDADADPAADNGTPSSWWVLFGGNGVGKSSILRAVALVLAGDTPAASAAGRRLLRTGATQGLIEVQVGPQTLKTRLISERSTVIVSSSQQTPVQLGSALVLAFPALRGARAPDPTGPSARTEIREPEPSDLQALIAGEVDGRLADFKQWLVNVLVNAESDRRCAQMRALLNDLIREIIPGRVEALSPLRAGEFIIRVQTPEGEVPFDDLSQGMASIFNWVGLLVQRLFTICEASERPQDEPAIVIVDEIDAHLHPEWQRRLVLLTRKFFPNVQILATSHSPLLAGALRQEEMCVLERDLETGEIRRVRHAETYGLNSQDILTSGAFDMSTDRNPEVEGLILRYITLFEALRRTPEEELELQHLREMLKRYGFAELRSVALPLEDKDHIESVKRLFAAAQEASE